jgi:hypothetical protein
MIKQDPDLKFQRVLGELAAAKKVGKDAVADFAAEVAAIDSETRTGPSEEAVALVAGEEAAEDEDADGPVDEGDDIDGMPETKLLNRLLAIIACADTASAIGKPPKPPRPPISLAAAARMDTTAKPIPTLKSTDKAKLSDRKIPKFDELSLLSCMYDFLDVHSIEAALNGTSYKSCCAVLSAIAASTNNASEVSISRNSSELHIALNEEEIVRIACALIVYGAPLVLDNQQLMESDKEVGGHVAMYDWKDFIRLVSVNLQPKYVRYFYETCWLPFCFALSNKSLQFLDRRTIPNPLTKAVDHSLQSRGLSHLFLLRQRRVRAVHFVLTEARQILIEHLRRPDSQLALSLREFGWTVTHDLDLLHGCLSFGYMAFDSMRSSLAHSFHASKYGANIVFPPYEDVEMRLVDILKDATAHLPMNHCCRVVDLGFSGDGIDIKSMVGSDAEMEVKQGNAGILEYEMDTSSEADPADEGVSVQSADKSESKFNAAADKAPEIPDDESDISAAAEEDQELRPF